MSHRHSAKSAWHRSLLYGFALLAIWTLYQPLRQNSESTLSTKQIASNYGQLPLLFEANEGQTTDTVRFISRGASHSFLLTDKAETTLTFNQGPTPLQLKLRGANPTPSVTGLERASSYSNYFVGSDPKAWRSHVAHYAKVKYEQVYPGVDLVFYGNQSQLEYDFIVQPQADTRQIQLELVGANTVSVAENGDLLLRLGKAEIRQHKPETYQLIAGVKKPVASHYILQNNHQLSFEVGEYDHQLPLIIDPVLAYSTDSIGGVDIAVDPSGNAYVVGATGALPFRNAMQEKAEGTDVYIAKLNSAGTDLVFATYLGGNGDETGRSIALDQQGNIYVAGTTNSGNLPSALNELSGSTIYRSYDGGTTWQTASRGLPNLNVNWLQAHPQAGQTLYTNLLSSAGKRFARSLNGGTTWAFMNAAQVDASATNFFFDPSNASTLYAVNSGLFKSTNGGTTWDNITNGLSASWNVIGVTVVVAPSASNVVYVSLNPELLVRSTNGGNTWQAVRLPAESRYRPLAVDPKNPSIIYLDTQAGLMKSIDSGINWISAATGLPLASGVPVFLEDLVIDPKNTSTLYASGGFGVYKSTNGGLNWAQTNSGLPVGNFAYYKLAIDAQQPANIYAYVPRGEAFKSTNSGSTWQKLTLPAGKTNVWQFTTDAQASGNIYLTPAPFFGANITADSDAFIAKLNPAGSSVTFSRYIGGAGAEQLTDFALGNDSSIYLTGVTNSDDFPVTTNAYQKTRKLFTVIRPGATQESALDAFAVKLTAAGAMNYATYFGGTDIETEPRIAADNTGNFYLAGKTNSTDMVAKQALQPQPANIFLAKFAPALTDNNSLIYNTFFASRYPVSFTGTDTPGICAGLKVDSNGSVYLLGTGATTGSAGSFQSGFGSGFIAKVNAAGTALQYLTMVGAQTFYNTAPAPFGPEDLPADLALDANGNAYIVGKTIKSLPTSPDAVQPQRNLTYGCGDERSQGWPCSDGFLIKLNSTGTALTYATFFGGNTADIANAVAVDSSGNAYVTGAYGGTGFGYLPQAPVFPATSGAFKYSNPLQLKYFTAKFALGTNPLANLTSLAHASAASYARLPLAPESIATVFGTGLATGTEAARTVPLPTSLAGTTVKVGDQLAPLFFVSPTQINYLIPPNTPKETSVPVIITDNQGKFALSSVLTSFVAPGLFAANADGKGIAAGVILRVKANGQQIYEPILRFDTAQNRYVPIPIDLGTATDQVFLVLFGTGWREATMSSFTVAEVGGITTPILYLGAQPSLVGVDQLNIQLPPSLAGRGLVNINLTLYSRVANSVQVQIK